MASFRDDDDDGDGSGGFLFSSDEHRTSPNPSPNHAHHHPQPPSFHPSAVAAPEVAESRSDEPFHDAAAAAFAVDENFASPADRGKSKRRGHEELSDGGTDAYKKSKSAGTAASSEYRKDREDWSDAAIACLLDAYAEKFAALNRGNLRGRDWEEVAAIVSERCRKQMKSVEQCKNKVDNLKKRFKLERHRMSNGGVAASHWPWYKKLEEIVGNMLPARSATNEQKGVRAGTDEVSAAPARQSKR